MLEVKVTSSDGQHSGIVHVYGFDILTPRAARAALQIAGYNTGETWTMAQQDAETGAWDYASVYGYRVYDKSARKLHALDL